MCCVAALRQEVIFLKQERSSLNGPAASDALIETLTHERDAARTEVNSSNALIGSIARERDAARAEASASKALIGAIGHERDAARAEVVTVRRRLNLKERARLLPAKRGKRNPRPFHECASSTHAPFAAGPNNEFISQVLAAITPSIAASSSSAQVPTIGSTTMCVTPTQMVLSSILAIFENLIHERDAARAETTMLTRICNLENCVDLLHAESRERTSGTCQTCHLSTHGTSLSAEAVDSISRGPAAIRPSTAAPPSLPLVTNLPSTTPPSVTTQPTVQSAATSPVSPSFTDTPTDKSNTTLADATSPAATPVTPAVKSTPYTANRVAPAAEACFGLINCLASVAGAQSATMPLPTTIIATPNSNTMATGAQSALINRAPAASTSTPSASPRQVTAPPSATSTTPTTTPATPAIKTTPWTIPQANSASTPSASPRSAKTPITPQPTQTQMAPTTTSKSSPPSTTTPSSNSKRTPTPTKATPTPAAPAPPGNSNRRLTFKPKSVITTPRNKPSPLGQHCVTAGSPRSSKTTITTATTKRVTPNSKTNPTTPEVKVAAGMSGLINRSPVAVSKSSPSRLRRPIAVPAKKHRMQPVQVTAAAESVPGLISRVSAAAGASTPSRLAGAVAMKTSPGQASKTAISPPDRAKKVCASKDANFIKQTSPKTGGPSPVRRSNSGGPEVLAVDKPKRAPSTLLSNPKLHNLLRNPVSRQAAKASGALMYKQRPMRL
ncbi:hypothetical protein HDU81_010779 [Chytriomyces hyalinus]|nr:hypothetical protein HDU81_010779 [Chytriomyces hyalinus]